MLSSRKANLDISNRSDVSVSTLLGVDGEVGEVIIDVAETILDTSFVCCKLAEFLSDTDRVDEITGSIFSLFVFLSFRTSFRINNALGNISSCLLIISLNRTLSM